MSLLSALQGQVFRLRYSLAMAWNAGDAGIVQAKITKQSDAFGELRRLTALPLS